MKLETLDINYNGEKYTTKVYWHGKNWFSKPCFEITKGEKTIYKKKTNLTFVFWCLFTEKEIMKILIDYNPMLCSFQDWLKTK